MANSIEQTNNGRGKDKNDRKMHPNSLKNLKPNPDWKSGQSGNPQGQSITARQKEMMSGSCPFDGQGRTWLESLAEGGMRQALNVPVALSNLQDRHEGSVNEERQPIIQTFVFVLPDGTRVSPGRFRPIETKLLEEAPQSESEGLID